MPSCDGGNCGACSSACACSIPEPENRVSDCLKRRIEVLEKELKEEKQLSARLLKELKKK